MIKKGIIKELYEIENNIYTFIDVGGQRNERKKWINGFYYLL